MLPDDFRREIVMDQALEPIIIKLNEYSLSESESEPNEALANDIEYERQGKLDFLSHYSIYYVTFL